ncbi:MAG: hypothetical protein WDO72_04690 [Pseudomonadota bacterium]
MRLDQGERLAKTTQISRAIQQEPHLQSLRERFEFMGNRPHGPQKFMTSMPFSVSWRAALE